MAGTATLAAMDHRRHRQPVRTLRRGVDRASGAAAGGHRDGAHRRRTGGGLVRQRHRPLERIDPRLDVPVHALLDAGRGGHVSLPDRGRRDRTVCPHRILRHGGASG